MEVIIAPKARSDIASILAWTEERFGPRTTRGYGTLIATAIGQIADNPDRVGSSPRPDIALHCRTYHLYFSRKSAGRTGDRIRKPRHFILYRVTKSNIVEIGRVLHDSMDIQANLPESYRISPE